MQAVFSGYTGKADPPTKQWLRIDYDTPDYNMLANLEKNIYAFSGAKNYHEVRELTSLAKAHDSFSAFKDAAKPIVSEYQQHLRTEYETAIGGAQMASKWVDFQQGATDMPFLQYETAGDQRVRESHRLLDGVVKKIEDSFWKQYYPPNGWNCRCTVIQLPGKAHETPDKNITYPDVPKMWQVNTAEQNIIFPEGSPVFMGVPDHIKQEVFAMLPYERRYQTVYESKNGGTVSQHIDVDTKKPDFKLVSKIAMEKADEGKTVHILPELVASDPNRAKTLKGAKENKNPDLRINGQYVEVKEPELPYGKYTLSHIIGKGAAQADHVIVNILDKKTSEFDLYRAASGKLKQVKELATVEYRQNGKYIVFHKNKAGS